MSGLFGGGGNTAVKGTLASSMRGKGGFDPKNAVYGLMSGNTIFRKKTNNTILGSTVELPFPTDPYSVAGRTAARKKATQAAASRKGYASTILSQDMYQ